MTSLEYRWYKCLGSSKTLIRVLFILLWHWGYSLKGFLASILYKSIAGRYRPVSYPDGPITARYRLTKNAYWLSSVLFIVLLLCFVDPFQHCDHLGGDKGTDWFAFLSFLTCVLSFLVCFHFLLVTDRLCFCDYNSSLASSIQLNNTDNSLTWLIRTRFLVPKKFFR